MSPGASARSRTTAGLPGATTAAALGQHSLPMEAWSPPRASASDRGIAPSLAAAALATARGAPAAARASRVREPGGHGTTRRRGSGLKASPAACVRDACTHQHDSLAGPSAEPATDTAMPTAAKPSGAIGRQSTRRGTEFSRTPMGSNPAGSARGQSGCGRPPHSAWVPNTRARTARNPGAAASVGCALRPAAAKALPVLAAPGKACLTPWSAMSLTSRDQPSVSPRMVASAKDTRHTPIGRKGEKEGSSLAAGRRTLNLGWKALSGAGGVPRPAAAASTSDR
mmetsp:Transcript_11568/g.44905  ORF Transcript_11568/g.44905 Transcript_11568/m.44905 type:complete len:283 (-) Transcript_11568:2943-3791(-)